MTLRQRDGGDTKFCNVYYFDSLLTMCPISACKQICTVIIYKNNKAMQNLLWDNRPTITQ